MKAILILDMPKSCGECPIYNGSEMLCCGCKVRAKEINTIPSWCFLKPLPQKILDRYEAPQDYRDGWNDCIDEILGEEE